MDGERSRQVHAGSLWNRVGLTNRVRNRFQPSRRMQPYVRELGVGISKQRNTPTKYLTMFIRRLIKDPMDIGKRSSYVADDLL